MEGAEVRAKREALGMTQAEFAAALVVGRGMVAKWENGIKPVSRASADKIAALAPDPKRAAPIRAKPKRAAPSPVAKAYKLAREFPPEPGAGDALRQMVDAGASWNEAFSQLLTLGAEVWAARRAISHAAELEKLAKPDRLAVARQAMADAEARVRAPRPARGPKRTLSRQAPPRRDLADWDGVDDVYAGDD